MSDLFREIKATPGIEGITITGGEPLDQAVAVRDLIVCCKSLGLTVVLYSGYEMDEIRSDPAKQATVDLADIAIIGRFQKANKSSYLQWRGCSNKEFIFHNDDYQRQFRQNDTAINELEIHIQEDGSIIVAGYPDADLRKLFKNATILPR